MLKYKVVLVKPKYEGNIGAIARVMMNFGFTNMVIVSPLTEIGLEARKRAMHAYPVLEKAKYVDNIEEAISNADVVIGTTGVNSKSKRNILRSAISPRAMAYMSSLRKGTGAILFGTEDNGLTNEELNMCDFTVTIPTNPSYGVMNLSHAVGIVLYELYMANYMKKDLPITNEKMNGKVYRILIREIENLMEKIDYPINRRKKVLLHVRKILISSWPSEEDNEVLLGIIKRAEKMVDKSK